jgi:predicted AAA+ superfamily ATPase
MEWYEELDFDENPFVRPTKTIGYEDVLDEAFYAIMAGNMLFVQGTEGSGKTQILKEIIKKFGGRRKIIYVNCKELEKDLNIEELMKKSRGMFAKMFNDKPKNMILLLDEIEHLSPKNCERIKYYYDQNFLRSVVFSSRDSSTVGFHESIKQRLNKVLTLKPLSDYEAVQLVREKIGYDLLSDRIIKEVYRHSGRNNKSFLKNCEKVCTKAVNKSDLKEDDVQKILAVAK